MRQLDRREMLKTTGTGAAVTLGLGTVSTTGVGADVGSSQSQEVVNTFVATGVGGEILINKNTAPTDPLPLPTSQQQGVDQDIQIWGEVYADGTWESQDVVFPNILIPEEEVPIDLISGDIELFVTPVDQPYTGNFVSEPGNQELTVNGTIELELPPDLGSLFPNLEPISIELQMTTGQSNELEGNIQGLNSASASGTVVDNTVGITATGVDLIDDNLGLPAPPGSNEVIIDLDMDISPPPIGEATSPPLDLDGDGMFENLSGSGTFDVNDVQMLFDNLDSPRVQRNSGMFNFSGTNPNEVTVFDVQAHFNQFAQQE
mgnify:CR=1 FL=1